MAMIVVLLLTMGVLITDGIHVMSKYTCNLKHHDTSANLLVLSFNSLCSLSTHNALNFVCCRYMADTCKIETKTLRFSSLQKSCDDLNWLSGLNTVVIVVSSLAMGMVLMLLAITIYITRSQGIPYVKYMAKER